MFPIFTIFLIFIVALNVALHRQRRSQEEIDKTFWERETAANNTRKQDISNLDYIAVPLDVVPEPIGTDTEKALADLSSKKLLNLTGLTNTQLKLKYGVANLEALSEYEANFTQYVSLVPVYAAELIEAGQRGPAKELLTIAVEQRADSCPIYTLLARLYCEDGQRDEAKALLDRARRLDSISGRIIAEKLDELLGEG